MIVISPHLDDAALSCGQALAAYPGALVVTVFAGVPPEGTKHTDFDERSGWETPQQAVSGRQEEDLRAMAVLDARAVHLDLLDSQYRDYPYGPRTTVALEEQLRKYAVVSDPVLIPYGVEHPDHVEVGVAARRACEIVGRRYLVYEELPGRVLWPEHVRPFDRQLQLYDDLVQEPRLELKRAAIACYRSQLWALHEHACLVPERYWAPITEAAG